MFMVRLGFKTKGILAIFLLILKFLKNSAEVIVIVYVSNLMKTGEVGVFTLEADVVPVYDDLPEPGVDLQRLGQQPRPAVPHPVTADVQHLLTHPSLERGQRSFAKIFTKSI